MNWSLIIFQWKIKIDYTNKIGWGEDKASHCEFSLPQKNLEYLIIRMKVYTYISQYKLHFIHQKGTTTDLNPMTASVLRLSWINQLIEDAKKQAISWLQSLSK